MSAILAVYGYGAHGYREVHACPGTADPNRVGHWSSRGAETYCGLPTSGCFSCFQDWSEVDCERCKESYVALKLGVIPLGQDAG